MTKKQKKTLHRILKSAALYLAAWLGAALLPLPALLSCALYLPAYLLIGHDVLRKAWLGIRGGEVFDENFLMAVATLGALALGDTREAVAVMLFYQVGELFQSYAVGKSRRSIAALMDIRPDSANLLAADGSVTVVAPAAVPAGSTILVRAGERIPLDGTVTDGQSTVNTAALTGESRPRSVRVGDSVISGCINESGLLQVCTTKPYAESTVNRILELVENSSLKKARSEAFITRFARVYTPFVCIAALLLAVVPPLFVGDFATWLSRALTFLVISCPCALVISVPLTFFGGIGGASAQGILIKGGSDLENLAKLSAIAFDKTGTLTRGEFAVQQLLPAEGVRETQLLQAAACAETHSSHPIAAAVKAVAADMDIPQPRSVQELAGFGVVADTEMGTVLCGNLRLMQQHHIAVSAAEPAGTAVHVALGGAYLGCISIADSVKPTARQAVAALHAQKLQTVLLTGDSAEPAREAAAKLGISRFYAGLLPADKVTHLETLLAEKKPGTALAFVGDGINDAPVLMRADVGIAMGALGSDAAIEAADVVLMDDDPLSIPLALSIARKCMRIVRQNIAFALGVKGVSLILGALGFVNMWWAVFSDVGVMVLAVLNATRMLLPHKKN
ncbi:MAG: cadmium-translocating P-type ATPase [Oscillospiraceae bacterium]|nr:cadmium-translocating P-type ATPase [Oscillospiraceae bacterium]